MKLCCIYATPERIPAEGIDIFAVSIIAILKNSNHVWIQECVDIPYFLVIAGTTQKNSKPYLFENGIPIA